jgi:hypothetical protein
MYSFGETRIVYRPLTASAAIRMLHNPRYAGAYAYGRRKYRKTVNGAKVSPIQDINCHHRDKMNPSTAEKRTHLTGF